MNIQVKSSNGITLVPIETKLLSERKVFIEGEIDNQSAIDFVKKIMLLCSEDSNAPIDVFVNSPGGEISSGLLMYDVIQSSETPIRMICLGTAYSMGALLFISGKERYMLKHSELMIHEPLLGNRVGGSASSIKSISDSLLETRQKINEILSMHSKKTIEEIEEATRFDHYFSPEESIEFGFADKVVNFTEIMEGL